MLKRNQDKYILDLASILRTAHHEDLFSTEEEDTAALKKENSLLQLKIYYLEKKLARFEKRFKSIPLKMNSTLFVKGQCSSQISRSQIYSMKELSNEDVAIAGTDRLIKILGPSLKIKKTLRGHLDIIYSL